MNTLAAITVISSLAVLVAILLGAFAVVAGIVVLVKVGGGVLSGLGVLLGRIVEFVGGVFGDAARLVGAVVAAVVLFPLTLANVVIGRWSAANHFAEACRRELTIAGGRLWSLGVRRPLRLLFLEGMLEGVEDRAVDAVRQAPGPDRPRRGLEFPGFEITGSLPTGGSGARLYVARPDEATRRRLRIDADEVVIKSFALEEGSSLPQIVRESRSLDAARRLGLVLVHELDDTRFWYAMPYHPGDSLSVVVRHAHGFADASGLDGAELGRLLGYAVDLVGTLDRYHAGGMWHKDVKPDNIIVHDGAAHLVDFGLVSSLKSAMTLTTHGTEYFRDPEMVRMALRGVKVHEVNGAKFDVYGAGAVLYFMLENTFPAHGGLSRFERPSPEALRMIVRRAMADYAHRYESAADMLADLQAVAAAEDPWSVKPAALPSLRGASGSPVTATVADGVAGGDAGDVEVRGTTPPPRVEDASVSSRPGRPDIRVTGWWTGAYVSSEAPRPRARTQVAQARSRAAQRRRAVARPSRGPVSAVLQMLLLGATSAAIAFGVVLSQGDSVGVDGEVAVVRDVRDARIGRLLGKPDAVDRPRVVVLDDQGMIDGSTTRRLATELRSRLVEEGWEVARDAELEARVRALPDLSRRVWSPEASTTLGLDLVFWIRPADRVRGVDHVTLHRIAPEGDSWTDVPVDRLESDDMDGTSGATATGEGTEVRRPVDVDSGRVARTTPPAARERFDPTHDLRTSAIPSRLQAEISARRAA